MAEPPSQSPAEHPGQRSAPPSDHPSTAASVPASPEALPICDPAVARFRRIMDIFLLAVDHDDAGRERIIQQHCADHPDMAADLRIMLEAEPPPDRRDTLRTSDQAGTPSEGLGTGAGIALGAGAAHAELAELEREAAAALRTLPVIHGQFRIIRTLGEGGMGVVYLAEQDVPRRLVALKAIRAGLASRSVLTRFIREANILGRLHHPGIAQIHDCGVLASDDTGRAFIVLEYIDGPTITHYVKALNLDEPTKLLLLAQVCDAVHHAHLRGVIHRDLKPGNILVESTATGNSQPKVLDFGVARLEDAPVGTIGTDVRHAALGGSIGGSLGRAIIGTPGYMSPEQLDGDSAAIDATSDVYALGVILYQLLAGKAPFDVASKPLAEAARLVRFTAPPRIEALSRARRTDLETIIAQAMHVERARRYQSAAALAEDLRAAAEGRPISARRDSALYVLSKLAARHRVVFALAASLFFAVLSFAIFAAILAQRSSRLAAEADIARFSAESQRANVQDLNTKLASELQSVRIARGRAEAVAGRLRLAEDSLWAEALADPNGLQPRWALAELYQRVPVQWALKFPGGAMSMTSVHYGGQTYIAAGFADGTLRILDESGQQLNVISGFRARVTALAGLSKTGEALVGLSNGRAAIISVVQPDLPRYLGPTGPDNATAPPSSELHARGIREIDVSDDECTWTFLGADRRVSIWDGPSKSPLAAFSFPLDLFSLALSPDGTQIVVSAAAAARPGSESNCWLVAYRLSGRRLQRLWTIDRGETGAIQPLVYARAVNGQLEVIGGRRDFHLEFIDPATGAAQLLPRRMAALPNILAPSPDRRHVLVGVDDSFMMFDTSTRTFTSIGQHEHRILAVTWSSDTAWVAANAADIIRASKTRPDPALNPLERVDSWTFAADWSPDGAILATTGTFGKINLYNGRTFALQASIPVPIQRTRMVQWMRNADTLVLASRDGRVRVASALDGQVIREFLVTPSEIYAMAVDPSESMVATGHQDRTLRVSDLHTGEVIANLPRLERRVESIVFSSDGTLMFTAGAIDGVQVWNTSTWKREELLPTTAPPWAVRLSRDGRTLLAGTHDGTLDVFSATLSSIPGQRFIRRASIQAHQRLIPALSFSHSGEFFSTGSEDGTFKIWHTQTLRNLATFDVEAGYVLVSAFRPDDQAIVIGNSSRVCNVLDLAAMFRPVDQQRAFHAERIQRSPGLTRP